MLVINILFTFKVIKNIWGNSHTSILRRGTSSKKCLDNFTLLKAKKSKAPKDACVAKKVLFDNKFREK